MVWFQALSLGHQYLTGDLDLVQYDHHGASVLSHSRPDAIRKTQIQDNCDWKIRVQLDGDFLQFTNAPYD